MRLSLAHDGRATGTRVAPLRAARAICCPHSPSVTRTVAGYDPAGPDRQGGAMLTHGRRSDGDCERRLRLDSGARLSMVRLPISTCRFE